MPIINDEKARKAIATWIREQYEDMERWSYYQLLGVARDAGVPVIRDAYYNLVARFHPDLYVDSLDVPTRRKLVALYSRLVEAYRVLVDGAKRGQYDRVLERGRLRWSHADDVAAGRDPETEFKNPNARRFYRLGCQSLRAGDAKSAVMNLKLALSVEPDSDLVKRELAKAVARLKPRGG